MAREISKFLDVTKIAKNVLNENDAFTANVEIHIKDPAFSKKSNIFGIKLDDKVNCIT